MTEKFLEALEVTVVFLPSFRLFLPGNHSQTSASIRPNWVYPLLSLASRCLNSAYIGSSCTELLTIKYQAYHIETLDNIVITLMSQDGQNKK